MNVLKTVSHLQRFRKLLFMYHLISQYIESAASIYLQLLSINIVKGTQQPVSTETSVKNMLAGFKMQTLFS